ncbi:MAG: hypothetical protein JO071_07975 [Deltaproteobacteria bacterium]|nr:hypothetical protein [Deltaproteobacteria bacterium]
MSCNHHLGNYLQDYIKTAEFADDREGALFRTTIRRTGGAASEVGQYSSVIW